MRAVILSLFPGIDLLGRAFEELGATVVRGPDLLWGGDVRTFHARPGCFDGVIGGPPCQFRSQARNLGTGRGVRPAEDLVGEFVRIAQEAAPRFVVMENVRGVLGHPAVPSSWSATVLRDWDCGGYTYRTRAFWTWPFEVDPPPRREGRPEHSVMA